MKKLIAAIVIASIGAAFAADPYYVYEYKASIKRLEISAKASKNVVTQKYSVKSDTIWGFVTIPACQDCSSGTLIDGVNSTYDAINGYSYLTMKGNSKLVTGTKYLIVKAPVKAAVGVFGGDQKVTSGDILDTKKVTKAWMALDFPVYVSQFGTADLVANKNLKQAVPFSFFGLTNSGESGTKVNVQNTGFGTAKTIPASATFCGQPGKDCLSVQTISGTLVGYPMYQGPCDHLPMWDLCHVATTGSTERENAVICGTWSLKYNKSLTNAYASANNDEDVIIKKFSSKASTSNVFEIDAKGNQQKTESAE